LKGVVLAAGPGRRLHPLTETLPKALLPLTADRTILDVALANLRSVGVDDVVVVTGFAAQRIDEQAPALERRHDVRIELVFNERAEEANNAYSLWLARSAFRAGALLVNGDTLHPLSVEKDVLAARGPELLLAVDREHMLGEEQMKVVVSAEGRLERIGKDVEPDRAAGEYIGVALIEAAGAKALADALERIWRRDPCLYYEDGFQEFRDAGGHVGTVSIGNVEWVEVDDADDLERAREIAGRAY
jgi:choline kinase